MKIDKSRFLFLTTTLAASTAAALVACATTTTSTETKTDSGTDSGGGAIDTESDGASTADASDASSSCLGESPDAGDAGTGLLCGPAGAGEDAGGFAKCSTECTTLTDNFKGAIAKDVNACLDKVDMGAPTDESCAAALPGCIKASLPKACVDDTALTFCNNLLPTCGDASTGVPTAAECKEVVTVLNSTGRQTLQGCVEEGAGGLGNTCVDCLKQIQGQFF